MATVDTRVRSELLEASDETIDDAVKYADPMVLRGLMYQLTGDEEILRTRTHVVQRGFGEAVMLADDDDIELVQRKAAAFLKDYRDQGAGEISVGPEERLHRSFELTAGLEFTEEEMGLCREEVALNPWARSLEWSQTPDPERLTGFSVAVIGAGMGGLNAAVQLKRAGIEYTVFEKNSGVGGTWYENRYPGARVDTLSRAYTNLFGVDFGYPYPFCPWTENEKYFDWIADTFELRDSINFETEVRTATWIEEDAQWELVIDGPNGESTIRANAIITAVGCLSRPNIPEFEGMLEFGGPSWHTARWPEGFETEGKRFAVIGTGCSGYQLVPELRMQSEHVSLFQRTPQWLNGTKGYRSPFPPQVNWMDRNFPFHTNFMRLRSALTIRMFSLVSQIDPEFEDEKAVSPINKRVQDACMAFLNEKLGDSELVAKMTPPHPVLSARGVNVDPEYSVLDAIQTDNVDLVTKGIKRINRHGIEDVDGVQYDVDVIVYATGFHANDFLFPMTIIGRGGKTLEEMWADGGARAHKGTMVPGFPNMWMIYGPNTNGGLYPSSFEELEVLYALQCMEKLILDDKRAVEPTEEAYWRFNEEVDRRNEQKAWSDRRAHNYYWTNHGRSVTQCPWDPWESWEMLRYVDFGELTFS